MYNSAQRRDISRDSNLQLRCRQLQLSFRVEGSQLHSEVVVVRETKGIEELNWTTRRISKLTILPRYIMEIKIGPTKDSLPSEDHHHRNADNKLCLPKQKRTPGFPCLHIHPRQSTNPVFTARKSHLFFRVKEPTKPTPSSPYQLQQRVVGENVQP